MDLFIMELTISAAAKAWHISRQTLYNKLKDGELSYKKDDKGRRIIDRSEMLRLFGEPGQENKTSHRQRTETSTESVLIDTLKEQLAIANKRIDTLEKALDDKDAKILELLRELQGDFSRFLEHQPKKRPEVIALPQDEPVMVEPPAPATEAPKPEPAPVKNQPKKKRGLLQRVGVAIFDLD
jgi:hypothetical protein